MLNILFNAKKAERHPLEMMVIGFFYTSISILLSLWIIPDYASLVMVFFTVISCLYVTQKAIIVEEKAEKKSNSEKISFNYHAKALQFLLFLFLGFIFAFIFWTIVLPYHTVSILFDMQSSAITQVRTLTGDSISTHTIGVILANNSKVLVISFFLGLFYGAGAIFILVWNASVMGFLIGDLARNTFGIALLPAIIFKYFLHGLPEMLAYFGAALAGGILFISIIRGDIVQKPRRIISGVSMLLILSFLLLFLAALIEVYISQNL
ncbi:MAG: stage II sporulation protein M [Candidatus Nanoarchaeia archaeon]